MQEYKAPTFVVRYDPKVCIHAASCVEDLPSVFNIEQRPWINVNGADADRIEKQVQACPSGALSFERLTPRD